MKSGKIIGITVGSIVLLGAAIYFFIRGGKSTKEARELKKVREEMEKEGQTPTPPTGTTTVETVTTQTTTTTPKPTGLVATFSAPIRFGAKGNNVKEMQKVLLSIDRNSLPKYGADGMFGGETTNALIKILGKATVDNQADVDNLMNKALRVGVAKDIAIKDSLSALGITVRK